MYNHLLTPFLFQKICVLVQNSIWMLLRSDNLDYEPVVYKNEVVNILYNLKKYFTRSLLRWWPAVTEKKEPSAL